jgi:hypothetical protein
LIPAVRGNQDSIISGVEQIKKQRNLNHKTSLSVRVQYTGEDYKKQAFF